MKEAAIREELTPGSRKLYFMFGGIAAGLAMPPFEFYSSAKIIEENKIFLRDFSQAWYQNGLPGVGKTFYSVGNFIEQKIAELEPEEVFFVGNSMGGYAAILFASLIGMGTAIAFAPQTFVSPLKRLRHREQRWSKQINKMHLRTALKPHVWDLEAWLKARQSGAKTNATIEIYVARDPLAQAEGSNPPARAPLNTATGSGVSATRRRNPVDEESRLDYLHAAYLQNLDAVTVHTFPVGGHNLVKQLRDEGVLPAILSGTYAGASTGTEPKRGPRSGIRPLSSAPSVVGAPPEHAPSGVIKPR